MRRRQRTPGTRSSAAWAGRARRLRNEQQGRQRASAAPGEAQRPPPPKGPRRCGGSRAPRRRRRPTQAASVEAAKPGSGQCDAEAAKARAARALAEADKVRSRVKPAKRREEEFASGAPTRARQRAHRGSRSSARAAAPATAPAADLANEAPTAERPPARHHRRHSPGRRCGLSPPDDRGARGLAGGQRLPRPSLRRAPTRASSPIRGRALRTTSGSRRRRRCSSAQKWRP